MRKKVFGRPGVDLEPLARLLPLGRCWRGGELGNEYVEGVHICFGVDAVPATPGPAVSLW